jgi:hypothetical protein
MILSPGSRVPGILYFSGNFSSHSLNRFAILSSFYDKEGAFVLRLSPFLVRGSIHTAVCIFYGKNPDFYNSHIVIPNFENGFLFESIPLGIAEPEAKQSFVN